MKTDQIGLNLFSVRDYCQNEKDLGDTIQKLSAIGYRNVQVSAVGDIPVATIKKICADNNMNICATHESGKTIIESPQKVVVRLQDLDCGYTAYPYPHVKLENKDDALKLADQLARSGEILYHAGITLCYHNHDIELQRAEDKTLLDIILQNSPSFLQAEPDVFWLEAAGQSAAKWMKKLQGRMPLIHLKDLDYDNSGKPQFKELGKGKLDFDRIVTEATMAGCEYFLIEQDSNWQDNDPMLSAKISFDYLTTLLK